MPYPAPIWLRDFGTWLQTNGWGTEGTDLFIGVMPDQVSVPGRVMAALVSPASRGADLVYGTNGVPQATTSYPRAVLYFRDDVDEYLAPMERATQLYEVLLVTFAVVIGTNFYKRFEPLQEPYPIGNKDGTNRWTIGFNVEISRNL